RFGHIHAVLMPHAKFSYNRDRRFNAEAHTGFQDLLVTPHSIAPLMTVHTDAMACAVRQAGKLIIRTKTRIEDDFSRSGIYRLQRGTDLRSLEARGLGFLLQIPNL